MVAVSPSFPLRVASPNANPAAPFVSRTYIGSDLKMKSGMSCPECSASSIRIVAFSTPTIAPFTETSTPSEVRSRLRVDGCVEIDRPLRVREIGRPDWS